jgi:hypothetical protein
MKKLLLIILVSIFVLGCRNIDADVQTDEKIQGAWFYENGDYALYINAATMTVKYQVNVATPYRTEFSYVTAGRFYALTDNSVNNVWLNGAYPPYPGDIAANMTLLDYKDNVEVAAISVILHVEENILEIINIELIAEEYYYANAFPKIGFYYVGEGGIIRKNITDADFSLISKATQVLGKDAKITEADIASSTTTGKITITGFNTVGGLWPTGTGNHTVIFDVAATEDYRGATGLRLSFTLTEQKVVVSSLNLTAMAGTGSGWVTHPSGGIINAATGSSDTFTTQGSSVRLVIPSGNDDFNLAGYSLITITAAFHDKDGNLLATGSGLGAVKICFDMSAGAAGNGNNTVIKEIINLGTVASSEVNTSTFNFSNTSELKWDGKSIKGFIFVKSDPNPATAAGAVAKIRITEIKLHN